MSYPLFVINLAHQTRRWRFMEEQLGALGLKPTRIEAVNGRDPEARARSAVASYAPLSGGEIGVFESHRAIWGRVVDEGHEGAIAFEDDTIVASDFAQLEFPKNVLERADIIKLDEAMRPGSWYGRETIEMTGGERFLRRLWGTEMSAACYFVTNRGARRLLELSQRYFIPVDNLMFEQNSKTFWALDIWKLAPAAAMQMRHWKRTETLPDELGDSIQQDRLQQQATERPMGWRDQTLLRLRRLRDLDTRAQRLNRIRKGLAAADRNGGVVQQDIPFKSDRLDHVLHAEKIAFGE